jgi:DNA-binding transcriptional MerR regulator
MAPRTTGRKALTISEFGRQSGLSHKALRLYDLSGLLPPAEVDPATGYRLYSPEQLERARRISLLRQLDMPLATVAEILDGTDDEAVFRLNRWWSQQENAMQAKRDSMDYLRAAIGRAEQNALAAHPVHLRQVPQTKVATIRRDADQPNLLPTILITHSEIQDHLRRAGATMTGEWWVIFHGFVTPDSEAPVEICIPYTGTVDPAGPIVIRVEAAHTEAYCEVTKAECVFPRIMLAYDAMVAWFRSTGATSAGPVREIYLGTEGDPFAYVAEPIHTEPIHSEPIPEENR